VSIEFHCSHCGKLVRAPDNAGGRRGKCPYCKQSVYIPTPSEQLEELPLTPVDETEEQRIQRLEAEARAVQEQILADKQSAPEAPPAAESALPADPLAVLGDPQEFVVEYVRALHASDLERAEEVLAQLRPHRDAVAKAIERLRVDPVPPPALAGIPPNLLQGFLKKLAEEL